MTTASWVGVDLGTRGARALVATADGTVLARATRDLRSRRDGRRHEQDPRDWWDGVVGALREVTAAVDRSRLGGLAVSATSGTVVFVRTGPDDPVVPVTPALMYDDGRAGAEAERAAAAPAPAWSATGARPQPSWGLAKACWLLSHCDVPPDARLAHQVDVVTSRLVGEPTATDTSNALKSGVDLLAGDWPRETLAGLGLPPERLPPVVWPGTRVGGVGRKAAEATGLPAGLPVLAGLTDGCASQVAAGALEAGGWNLVAGTTLVLKGTTADPLLDPTGAVYSHRSPEGSWWPGGAASAGAGVWHDAFPNRELADLDRAAVARLRRSADPGARVTYPLSGVGERFPFAAPAARSFTLGVPDDDVDRYTALLVGLAFSARLCLDRVRALGAEVVRPVRLCGGATRSRDWSRMQADVLGMEVLVPAAPEAAFGAAVVAASSALGGLTAAARAMVRVRESFAPDADLHQRFEPGYARFVDELRRRGWMEGPGD